jgi:molybdopterin converting factor small subunit
VARVSTVAQQVRALTGGVDHFDIEASTLRALLAALDRRHPGLAAQISARMAIAIDGEIHHDALDVPLAPDSEVVLIPRISGG